MFVHKKKMDSTDPDCALGQVMAAAFCECARESRVHIAWCDDVDILLGENPLYACDGLIATAYANGCACPGEPFSGKAIDTFQSLKNLTTRVRRSSRHSTGLQTTILYMSASATPVETTVPRSSCFFLSLWSKEPSRNHKILLSLGR